MSRSIPALFLSLLLICCMLTPALADEADLAGKYEISGWNQGSDPTGEPDYKGWATLARWGDVWQYRGYMDGMTYAGAAIYDAEANSLSMSFTNVDGSERGVTLLKIEEGRLTGIWTMDNGGDGKLGAEIWRKTN